MRIGTGPGGRGSAAANAAVTQQCNGGVDLYNPQWFTLPVANLGKIYAHGTAWGFTVGGTQDYRFGVAVVDTMTGAVLTCSDNPVSATTARPLSVVIYFAQSYADCATRPGESLPRVAAPVGEHHSRRGSEQRQNRYCHDNLYAALYSKPWIPRSRTTTDPS